MNSSGRAESKAADAGNRARSTRASSVTGRAMLCLVLTWAVSAVATPGDLDPSFGAGGIVTTPMGTLANNHIAHALLLQPDRKLVAVGSGGHGFMIARYGREGKLDQAFGTGGIVSTTLGDDTLSAFAAVLQPDGKIVAAGSRDVDSALISFDFALARYESDGSLDPTFGTGGVVVTNVGTLDDQARALIRQPDGKLVAAGTTGADFALVRYNADGSLDSTFGTGGIVITDVASGQDLGEALVVQPDGKLVVAGWTHIGAAQALGLVRYESNGTLDPTFGSGGITKTTGLLPEALILQPDGMLVAGGLSIGGANGEHDFALARYTAVGGSAGMAFIDVSPENDDNDQIAALALQPDRSIVAVGGADAPPSYAAGVVRYDNNGSLDLGFGSGGVVITPDLLAKAVVVQPDGKIAVAGFFHNPPGFGLARYCNGDCTNVCGDGFVLAGVEECDDEETSDGDGCDSDCKLEPLTVTDTVGPGGALSTDTGATGATASLPLQATVVSPTGGAITITRDSSGPPMPGFEVLSGRFHIDAPPATSTDPVVFTFLLDTSVVPYGEDENTLRVLKDGQEVTSCSGTPGEASPDPCVASRTLLGEGDVELVVRSSTASDWTFALPNATSTSTTTTSTSSTTTSTVPAARNKCAGAKIKAAGKSAKCLLSLKAKEAKSSVVPDAAKAANCKAKLAATFRKSEAQGGCITTGDAEPIQDKVHMFVVDADAGLSLDLPNGCQASKLKAAGKKAACLLGLAAKEAGNGIAPSTEKIQKCKDKLVSTFSKAELKGGCNTTGDAQDIEDKVDAFVLDVDGELTRQGP